jgi:sugar O-acyltransferase (sialic acid O-acetyltransferase NeuD family)
MDREPLLLVGAGGHARACIDVLEAQAQHVIAGLVGLAAERGGDVLGYPVLGTDDELAALAAKHRHALVALGQVGVPGPRVAAWRRLLELGFELPVVVSPRAQVSRHAQLGPGSIVMHGAVVNAGARIGANCIVNSQALIEHDASVGDHCHVATAAVVNGGVALGEGSFVGSGSVLREGIVLGAGCIVGMGLALRHDLPAQSRYLGAGRT